MEKKIRYSLLCILPLVLVSIFIYKKTEPSRQLKKQELLEASIKLKQTYSNLNSYLIKIDSFSNTFIKVYLPKRDLVCGQNIDDLKKFSTLLDIAATQMHHLDYEMGFLGDDVLWNGFLPTLDYTQELNSPNELVAESDPDNKLFPINHYTNAKINGDSHGYKDGWMVNLIEVVDGNFTNCAMSKNELTNKYTFYNNMLKDDIKDHMKKIEEFYKKNNLNLNDLK